MIEQVYSHAKYQIILFRYVLDKYRKKSDIYRKYPIFLIFSIFSIFLKKSWFFPSLGGKPGNFPLTGSGLPSHWFVWKLPFQGKG